MIPLNMLKELDDLEDLDDSEHHLHLPQRRMHGMLAVLNRIAQGFCIAGRATLPSFAQQVRKIDAHPAREVLPTSYLSGLRGVVAVLVYFRNFSSPYHDTIDYGYGQQGSYNLLRLPILRIIYSGPWVPIMFVVSGYVSAIKPLKIIRAQNSAERLLETMAQTVIRRPTRLFLPPIISTFGLMIATYCQLCDFGDGFFTGEIIIPTSQPALWEQFTDWERDSTKNLLNLWNWRIRSPVYGPHLWTIPVQFKGSMLLVLTFLIIMKARKRVRQALIVVLSATCVSFGRWDAALFLGGVLLCENDFAHQDQVGKAGASTTMDQEIDEPHTYRILFRQILWSCYVLLGLYIGSVPRKLEIGGALGFDWMRVITADYAMWDALSGFMLVHALTIAKTTCSGRTTPIPQAIFNGAVPQYFGEISYSFYIMHHPVNLVLGARITRTIWKFTGNGTSFRREAGFALGLFATFPVLLWLADIYWRIVEKKCSAFALWVETKLFE